MDSASGLLNSNCRKVNNPGRSRFGVALQYIWRFLPDGIAIFCGLIMSTDGPGTYDQARIITWLGVPYIIMAFLVVVSLQRGEARMNLSRLFLESPPMNLLGYISYPMCKSTTHPPQSLYTDDWCI